MEGTEKSPRDRSFNLGRPSRSFRLRCPSLNSLRLRRVFDIFDHNGDGEITVDELSLVLDRLGLGVEPSELASTVSVHISPGRSGLDFADFERLHCALGDSLFGSAIDEIDGGDESDMEEAFRVFDEDGDGYISAVELQAVLTKLGLPEARSIARVNDMICSVDLNRDGRVDFLEFKHMMRVSVKTSG
ncbi:hypothetical protein HPP92_024679 [Vanilla planifolia]|uniref:EF-hand domain-containing protein n=1 Tax=Vanilla planifolia TaxID=51239 RepID=A0A835PJ54_VANPL|nr:hypothetical protein HPP92_024679 [Vanilla planifolia]